MKKSVIFTIALLVLLIPAALSAQGTCALKEKATCKEKMELSEEQLAKIAELKLEQEIAGIKLGAELKILKLTMKQEMSKDDPSEKELKALVSKIAAIKEKQNLMKIEHMLAMRKILGPENWKMHKKCCGGMGGHGCMGKGCGGCGCCGMSGGCGMAGHCCTGMGCGSAGCCGTEMCGAGCCGAGERVFMMKGCCGAGCGGEGHSWIMDSGCSAACCGNKTVDVHKIFKTLNPGEMKGCMHGKDAGKNIEQRCIKIEKGK